LHRTSAYLNNRLEQDHRGIKDRYRSMRGFNSIASARRSCRTFNEVRNLLRVRSLQSCPGQSKEITLLCRTAKIPGILEAA
jgi:transposase-like protein